MLALSSLRAVRATLACWNVLADCYACGQAVCQNGENTYPQFIHWQHRSEKIAKSLRSCNADIICLQEVDHYSDFYDPLLVDLGYDSIYLQRPSRQDGCLIAYKRDKILLHRISEVQMDELADYMGNESSRSNLRRSNVALLALMEYIDNDRDKKKENALGNHDRMFVTSTAHIYWNPERPEVKNLQTQYLVGKVEKFLSDCGLSRTTPTLITGDFNSIPNSEVYSTMTHGFQYLMSSSEKLELPSSKGPLYGPGTKFLCDRNLSRLARWMRVLGIDAALVPEDKTPPVKTNKKARQDFDEVFQRARKERRVLLTTSKSMRERASCPPSLLLSTKNLEAALIEVCSEFGLTLHPDKFLTVCGKCSGEIESCSHTDPRVADRKVPTDREIFICIDCQQPYWWNERENSSPARAMKMADQLYNAVTRGLGELELGDGNGASIGVASTSSATSKPSAISASPTTATIDIDEDDKRSTKTPAGEMITDAIVSLVPDTATLSDMFALRDRTLKAKVVLSIGDSDSTSAEDELLLVGANTDSGNNDTDIGGGANRDITVDGERPLEKGDDVREELTNEDSHSAAATTTTAIAATASSSGLEERENASECDSRMQYSRKYRSAYAEVHGSEPDATNWSFDFKNTLDYVFVAGNCEVHTADVIPATQSILASRAMAATKDQDRGTANSVAATAAVSDSGEAVPVVVRAAGDSNDDGRDHQKLSDGARGLLSLEAGGLLSLEVDTAQPSEAWPSDHFMLLVELTFPPQTTAAATAADSEAGPAADEL